MLLLICALVPTALGGALPFLPLKDRRAKGWYALAATCLTSALVLYLALTGRGSGSRELLCLGDGFSFALRLDGAGKTYLCLAAILWPPAVLYAVEYMSHEERDGNFFCWYTVTYGAAILLGTADNLFTLYAAYEFLTLCTVPLVWHARDEKSTRAALQYMLFLIGGAALGFVAMAGLAGLGLGAFHGERGAAPGGEWFRALCLLGFLGFGVKAAVLPLSHWLPAASVAPTPVTALLHAVAVVNAGIFAVLRLLHYAIDPAWLRGTWTHTALLILSAATVLFGAAMAVRERHVKRRLAWSTVSNLSYMLLGLSLLTAHGMAAGLAHMVYHSLMKIILFFCAGAVTMMTGRTQLHQMHGLGRRMPGVFLSFTLAGASLLGVPPLGGFVSKYALITAAFETGDGWALAGAAAILVAAILTAVYIFTVVYPAFFMKLHLEPGEEMPREPGACVRVSLGILCALLLICSAFAGRVMAYLTTLAGGVVS